MYSIGGLIMRFESESVEFKQELTEGIYKEVIAFANTEGGVIYLGVDNEGNVIGVDDVDQIYTRLTNGIRDAIVPDVTMFVRYVLQEDKTIKIEVREGSYKPYYLKAKGIRPSGVFLRQGTSSVQASQDMIRQMIKMSDGDNFELMRSIEQELTFKEASFVFSKLGVDFSVEKFVALGIKNLHDDMFTNLGLLLSDQCKHTTKVAVFSDEDNTEFLDAREFKGSILKQMDECLSYIGLCNHTRATIEGITRVEHVDYPGQALREALLNSLIHRDYSYSASTIININASRIEFISIGGLLPGLTIEDIKSGISHSRNRMLAEVFHRLRLIESYGTGIRRIYSLYSKFFNKPEIFNFPNSFKLVLPNMNAEVESNKASSTVSENRSIYLTSQMNSILEYLREKNEMTEEDVQELLDVKRTRAYLVMKQMHDMGLVDIAGRGDSKRYRIKYLQ